MVLYTCCSGKTVEGCEEAAPGQGLEEVTTDDSMF